MKPTHYVGLAVAVTISASSCYKSRDTAAFDNSQARVEELLKEKSDLERKVQSVQKDKEKLRKDWESCDSKLREYASKADAGSSNIDAGDQTTDASTHLTDAGNSTADAGTINAGLRTTDAGYQPPTVTPRDAGYGHSDAGVTRHPLLEGMVNGRYDPIMIQDGEKLPAYLQISKECTSTTAGCEIVLEVRYEADHPGYAVGKAKHLRTDGGMDKPGVLFNGQGTNLTWNEITDIYICNSDQCSTTRPQDVADTYKPIFESLVIEAYRAAEDTFRKVTAAPKFK